MLVATQLIGFGAGDGDVQIIIAADENNVALREKILAVGWDGVSPVAVACIVKAGVVIGSSSTSLPGFLITNLPAGSYVHLVIEAGAYVVGAGGVGAYQNWGDAGAGGTALKTTVPIDVSNRGVIGGGGGGGSMMVTPWDGQDAGGSGGAGRQPGAGGGSNGLANGNPGTLTTGGEPIGAGGYYAGRGGDLGQAGTSGTPTHISGPGDWGTKYGAAAGKAVEGYSLITWRELGTVLGPTQG